MDPLWKFQVSVGKEASLEKVPVMVPPKVLQWKLELKLHRASMQLTQDSNGGLLSILQYDFIPGTD